MFQLTVFGMTMKPIHISTNSFPSEKEKMLKTEDKTQMSVSADFAKDDTHSYLSDVELRNAIVGSYCSVNNVLGSLSSRSSMYTPTQFIGASNKTMNSSHDMNGTTVSLVDSDSVLNRGQKNVTLLKEVMFLLRHRRFLLTVFTTLMVFPGCFLIGVYLPPHAERNGLEDSEIYQVTSIMWVLDLTGRVATSLFADSNWIANHKMIAISTLITGITSLFVPFYVDFSTILVYACIYGLFGGVYFALLVAVLTDFVGVAMLPTALGITFLVQGVISGVSMPILGEHTIVVDD